MEIKSSTKALFLSIALFAFGIVGGSLTVRDLAASLPLIIFYIILVLNTHFSVRLFAAIIHKDDKLNNQVDALLVLMFFLMAFNLHKPIYFIFFCLLLFILATIKYTLQIGVINHPRLLKRKVLIDLLGCTMCTLTLGGALLGYVSLSSWLFTIIFAIANLLLFFVWPMYRADSPIV